MSSLAFVVRRSDEGWVIRSQNILGENPIGPRLAKGTDFPKEFGLKFNTKFEAESVAEKWSEWYHGQPYLKKKRKNKYLA
jgi:hypothetical protein